MNETGVGILSIVFIAGVLLLLFGRVGRLIGSIVLTIAICSSAFFIWQMYHYDSSFDRVEIGSTQESTLSTLGKPTKITDCPITYGGYKRTEYDPAPAGCMETYWYYSFFTPEAWAFYFDENKKLIDKYHWVSP